MQEWLGRNWNHVLCGLVLAARGADLFSTYLATPKLLLEANPIAKKLGWKFGFVTLLSALLAYVDQRLAVVVLVASLMVASANFSKLWTIRALGESGYQRFITELSGKAKLSEALLGNGASALLVIAAGLVLWLIRLNPDPELPFWFGLGLISYGLAIGIYGAAFQFRLFRRRRLERAEKPMPPEVAR